MIQTYIKTYIISTPILSVVSLLMWGNDQLEASDGG